MPMLTYRVEKSKYPWGPDKITLTPGHGRCRARKDTQSAPRCDGRVIVLGEPNVEWGFIVQRHWGQDAGRDKDHALVLTVCEECGIVKAARKETM